MTTATLEPVTAAASTPQLASFAEVQVAALALADKDRIALLNQLAQSLPDYDLDDDSNESPPLSPAWIAEIERRSREIDEGLVTPIPYEEVMNRMKKLCQD